VAKFFIKRPIFAIVIALVITIIGLISAYSLPIAQYPQISNPMVNVKTNYVGANSEVVEKSVAQAIESDVNGVENMIDMRSVNDSDGGYSLNVQFKLGTDPDMAAVWVQNRVSQASGSLPSDVVDYGVTTNKQSSEVIMYLGLISPKGTYDSLFLKNYGEINFVDAMKRVNGVSDISIYGPELGMRIWLNPAKMAELKVTATDVATALTNQNLQAPVGSIGTRPNEKGQEFQYSASVKGRLDTVEEFNNVVVRSTDGKNLLLKDIARVEFGARSDSIVAKIDGGSSVMYAISLTTDANSLESVAGVKKVLAEAEKKFPSDMKSVVMVDNTKFINASLEEVVQTFFEALLLVVFIVFLFLQNWRTTLIPLIAVPVSLIGTFGAFIVLGFSINTLTLFAMILAIGLVVDDAIVVVEAVTHHIQANGMNPKEATIKAMEEVSGPVVAIAFILAAVFIPASFMSGIMGALYKQFALTIAVSVAISAFIALSLTPALCTLLLKPHDANEHKGLLGKFFDKFNIFFEKMTNGYIKNVTRVIKYAKGAIVALVIIVLGIFILGKQLPTAFVPSEDQGFFMGMVNLPPGASTNRTIAVMDDLYEEVKDLPGINHVGTISGMDMMNRAPKSSSGLLIFSLKPWADRTALESQVQTLIGRVFAVGAKTPAANIIAFNAPVLPGASSTGALSLVLTDNSGSSNDEFNTNLQKFLQEANKAPETQMVYTSYSSNTPSYEFNIDRKKTESLDVTVSSVFGALQTFLGGYEVNDFNKFGKTWKVKLQAESKFRGDVSNLKNFYVRSSSGTMVPINTLVTPKIVMSAPIITHYNGIKSANISGVQAAGVSTGEAMSAIENAAKILPASYSVHWVDTSLEEKEAGNTTIIILGISMIFVFLVLAALYESWSIPFSVLLSVPPAIFGCLFFQYFRGLTNDVYMQIGLITLIGLAAKNAILIVEYAKANVAKGQDFKTAAINAAKLRLRPILMTSFAFILGCVPLAISTGAGSGARTSMGNAVVFGMSVATLLGIFFIPVLFYLVEKVANRGRDKEDYKS
jgi:HAE1 family hydrophobic/amphiphilic exporter-1